MVMKKFARSLFVSPRSSEGVNISQHSRFITEVSLAASLICSTRATVYPRASKRAAHVSNDSARQPTLRMNPEFVPVC